MTPVILVDTSWLMYRGGHAYNLSSRIGGRDYPTGHIYAVLRFAHTLRRCMKGEAVFCRDLYPQERLERNAEYKSGRGESHIPVHADFKWLPYLLGNCDWVKFAEASGREADDVIAVLSKNYVAERETIIFSGDDDFLQLMKYGIKIARNFERGGLKFLEENHSAMKYGVRVEHLPVYRTIIGDKSDKLTGIPYFPRKLARDIASSVTTFSEIPAKFSDLMGRYSMSPNAMKYMVLLRREYSRLKENFTHFIAMDELTLDLRSINVYRNSEPGCVIEVADRFNIGEKMRRALNI